MGETKSQGYFYELPSISDFQLEKRKIKPCVVCLKGLMRCGLVGRAFHQCEDTGQNCLGQESVLSQSIV